MTEEQEHNWHVVGSEKPPLDCARCPSHIVVELGKPEYGAPRTYHLLCWCRLHKIVTTTGLAAYIRRVHADYCDKAPLMGYEQREYMLQLDQTELEDISGTPTIIPQEGEANA